jgi:hypothetical protein
MSWFAAVVGLMTSNYAQLKYPGYKIPAVLLLLVKTSTTASCVPDRQALKNCNSLNSYF